MSRYLFAMILLLFLSSSLAAQEKDSLQVLEERIEVLERQKEQMEKDFELESRELTQKAQQIELDLKGKFFWLGLFASTTIISLFVLLFTLYRHAKKIASSKIEDLFEDLFNEDRSKLVQMINSLDEEVLLKKQSSIVVFSPRRAPLNFLKDFFREFDFKNVRFYSIEEKADLKKVDVVFLNNENEQLSIAEILQQAENSPQETVFFLFGKKYLTTEELSGRIAFANSRMQLYGNLINALRYQTLLDK